MVFQVRLPGHLDEILLTFEGSGDGLVSGGLHAAAVCPQRAGRAACLGNAQRGSLGQDSIQPVLRNGLEVSGQGGVVWDWLAGPRYLYHGQVTFHIAGGLVPCDHQDADEVQFGSGVYGGSAPVALLLMRAWILPHEISYHVNQERSLGAMSQVVIHPIVRSSLVFDHCRVR